MVDGDIIEVAAAFHDFSQHHLFHPSFASASFMGVVPIIIISYQLVNSTYTFPKNRWVLKERFKIISTTMT